MKVQAKPQEGKHGTSSEKIFVANVATLKVGY